MQKQRDSNIELLRCLAMFLILVIHANFVSLPMIDAAELQGNTLPSVFRFFIESVGIVAINVFVFISGWYGIRPRKEKVLSLLFMVLWFFVGFYLVLLIAGKATLSWKEIADALQLSDYEWFIKSYFLLIIISPILNSFNATADEKTQRYVVIAFFLFEAVFGWIAGGRRFFVNGYGPLHFIGLYVTAGYIRNRLDAESAPQLFRTLFRLTAAADLGIFFLLAAVNTGLMIAGAMYSGSFSGVTTTLSEASPETSITSVSTASKDAIMSLLPSKFRSLSSAQRAPCAQSFRLTSGSVSVRKLLRACLPGNHSAVSLSGVYGRNAAGPAEKADMEPLSPPC